MSRGADHLAIIPAAGSSRRLAALTAERPKSMLPVAGRPLIVHSLEALHARGLRAACIVVGYRAEVIMSELGHRAAGIDIEYAVNPDYATTEHGFSLWLSHTAWARSPRPVLFLDADNVYDPRLLDRLLADPRPDVMMTDRTLVAEEREEELVVGDPDHDGAARGTIRRLVRGRTAEHPGCVGGFVGMNRLSADLMGRLYRFLEGELAARGPLDKYERVIDRLIVRAGLDVGYLDTDGLAWINVNHEADYRAADALAERLLAARA
ncbi:MAG: phosphocholine cytidylyltransferase family protein [Chromatiales bacterium]|nr:phosphocholine cytidylyltransferase family protein [Chromatiales bacterium]